jgi:hypothetical protein
MMQTEMKLKFSPFSVTQSNEAVKQLNFLSFRINSLINMRLKFMILRKLINEYYLKAKFLEQL